MAEAEGEIESDVLDNFTQIELQDLKEAFEAVDLENEDKITTKKLFRVMRTLGQNPTEAEVQDLINAVDDDGNGTIEFEEFAVMMEKKIREKDSDDEIKTAFKAFDHMNKGFITAEDLAELMSDMGTDLNDDEIHEMIRAVDTDGDGQVSLQDFIKLVK